MRLRPRPTVDEPPKTSVEDVLQLHENDLPLKLKSLLGTKDGPTNMSTGSGNLDWTQNFAQPGRGAEQGRLKKSPKKQQTSEKKPAMPPWPSYAPSQLQPQRSINDFNFDSRWHGGHPRNGSYTGVELDPNSIQSVDPLRKGSNTSIQPQQFYSEQIHKPSMESISREYYDAAQQSQFVSQQTSASAVRDMGLRKSALMMHQVSSEPVLATPSLKSAMKQSRGDPRPNTKEGPKKPKKLDLHSLFPTSKFSPGALGLLSPNKSMLSPPATTDASDYFAQETVQAHLRRQDNSGRFETRKTVATPSTESTSANAPRVKIFEPDVYNHMKTHQRRPPKGIRNWFDAFEISSDEEEKGPVELPAGYSPQSTANLSPYLAQGRRRSQPKLNGNVGGRPSQENMLAAEYAKTVKGRRIQRKPSDGSTLTDSASSEARTRSRQRGGSSGESRLASSRLEVVSVLSLSSESEDEQRQEEYSFRDGPKTFSGKRPIATQQAITSGRPEIPTRRSYGNTQHFADDRTRRQSDSTAWTQTSGSIPIRVADGIPGRATPAFRKGLTSPSVSTLKTARRPRSALHDASNQRSKSSPNTRSPHYSRDELQSAGGETNISSVPTEVAHVMAVTEEEMMLLELMRQKRAAMQNNSFAEGYKVALKQEQEHLARKRQSARVAAMKMSKKKEEMEKYAARSGANRSVRSRRESVFSEDPRDRQREQQEYLREQRKRYSMIRRTSVDRDFKMEKFLAMAAQEDETPVATMARLERFLIMKPSLLDAIQGSRPVSGTEIEAETMTMQETSEDDDFDMAYTETEEEYAQVGADSEVLSAKAFSPMQRLTDMVHAPTSLSVVNPPPSDDDEELDGSEEEDLKAVRAFLASKRASGLANLGAFPTPPSNEPSPIDNRQMSKLFPPVRAPDSVVPGIVPNIPERGPNRTPLEQSRSGNCSKSPLAPRPNPPNVRSAESEVLGSKLSPLESRSTQASPAHRLPRLDFSPLDLPPGIRTGSRNGSPSFSSSPLTPTFRVAPPDKSSVKIAGSDSANTSPGDSITLPEPKIPAPIKSSAHASKSSKKSLPQIDTATRTKKVTNRISSVPSMSSINSAGADVLAAWAELGGGNHDVFAARRRGK